MKSIEETNQAFKAWVKASSTLLKEFHDILDEHPHMDAVVSSFVEIPLQDRHFCFEFDRNESDIEDLKNRIIECRKYMNENLFNQ